MIYLILLLILRKINFMYINALHQQLIELKQLLDHETVEKYNRLNPFSENLINWKSKAIQLFGKDKNITIYDSTTLVGDIDIGNDTWIGPFCSLDGTGGLEIGCHCSISAGTHIQSHDTAKWALSGGIEPYNYQKVKIGNSCFIGVNCVVTAGVKIGNRCLIGAGAVVTKSFADNSIIAGVPAKKIGEVIVSEDGKIEYKYFKDNKNVE